MISLDIMILVVVIASLLFGFLIFSEPEDKEEFQYLWDESIVDEDVVYRAGNRVLTYQMLEEGRGDLNFENIGRDNALEVAQHFYQKGLEARGKGSREKAIDLFQQVHQISPKWLAPLHQLAELYLEKEDDEFAYEAYEDLAILFPKGYKDTITALFTLNLEREGSIKKGTFKLLKDNLRLPKKRRLGVLEAMIETHPNYAPTFLALAKLTDNPDRRQELINRGLSTVADDETYQQLLIEKAMIDAEEGMEYEAIYVLGDLMLNDRSTASAQMKAKQALSYIVSL